MSGALRVRARGRLRAIVLGPLAPYIRRVLKSLLLSHYLVYGDSERLTIADTAVVANTLFNTVSGAIRVEPHALFGHNVCLLTGTHDYRRFGHARQQAELDAGRDIVIGEGAWLASNVTVLGPCTIGPHAVVAAGAVVRADVAPYTVVAGVPAREVSTVEPGS